MANRLLAIVAFGCVISVINAAAIHDNTVYVEEPRINSGEQLISTIVSDCFHDDASYCLKTKVLNFMDTINGINAETPRAFDDNNIDKVIFDRVVRALNTHEFRVQLPETLFQSSVITYRADHGIDLEVPQQEEGRGDMLKKKLLLPVLLLLKLKMKVLMPIIVSLIGLKAMKALILSKIAIKLVLGFLIYNLVQKLGGMKMSMMPAPEPMAAYGVPAPTTPASSYEPSSWDQSSGGPYSRVWDSGNSAQSMAYSSYMPSSSSSSSSSTGSVSASSPSSYSSYSS